MQRFILFAFFTTASLALAAEPNLPETVDYNRDVRPILSDKCFACHGFDPKQRKADRRIDTLDGATAAIEGVRAIVPGDLKQSEAWQRIITSDNDDLMPPVKSYKSLSAAEKAILQRWIEQGAKYQKHWSFEAPVKPRVPQGAIPSTQAIDAFIRAKLAEHHLTPSQPASKEQLIRRVTLDLTGLPPTPAEVDAFLADHDEAAYQRVVDRLLHSTRYGENMARYWLDAARYGDTHGLHLDNERSIWPYRDWVVSAFNNNQSYDQFTVWQLAGDLLPNATREQQIASGFNRCNVTTSEGGAINEEWLFRYAVDRADTTMAVWMGLTAGCAVCHDHKFDPITQRDFYSMYAFFYSTADPAMDGNILLTPPILQLSSPAQKKQIDDYDQQITATQSKIHNTIAAISYTDPATLNPPPPPQTSEVVWFDDAFPAGVKAESAGEPTTFVTAATGQVHDGKTALKRTAKGVAQDYFAGGASFDIPPNGRIAAWCYLDPANPPKAVMLQYHVGGWNHRAVWGAEDAIPFGKARTAERVMMGKLPEAGKWIELIVPIERLRLKPGMKVTGYAFTQFDGTVFWDRMSIKSHVNPAEDQHWSWKIWTDKNQGKRVEGLPNDLLTLVRGKKPAEWPEADVKRLKDWWFENQYQGARDIIGNVRSERLALEAKKKTLADTIPATFVMADLPKERDAFIMQRGQYDKPGDKVTRRTPAVFPPLPTKPNYDRLDLAQWIVSPQQPLTARVAVNRFWQQFFGTGLVKTANDFGSQGEPPSHPELLDWLAVTFREQGWDVKQLVRMIVMSDTYRQSSATTPSLIAADPENCLLAHGPRFRLDAEVIRDSALYMSGLINLQLGGKGVRPYQPERIWEPVGFSGSNTATYKRDDGIALYRRSLYTFWKRTAPPPAMTTFDAPAREASCLRRERSNTPLQALVLMNDIQHVEASRNLAQRILLEGGTTATDKLRFAYRTVLSRYPTAQEYVIVEEALKQHNTRYAANADAAQKLIAYGDSKAAPNVNASELAAWTMIANLLMNLDEAVTR